MGTRRITHPILRISQPEFSVNFFSEASVFYAQWLDMHSRSLGFSTSLMKVLGCSLQALARTVLWYRHGNAFQQWSWMGRKRFHGLRYKLNYFIFIAPNFHSCFFHNLWLPDNIFKLVKYYGWKTSRLSNQNNECRPTKFCFS